MNENVPAEDVVVSREELVTKLQERIDRRNARGVLIETIRVFTREEAAKLFLQQRPRAVITIIECMDIDNAYTALARVFTNDCNLIASVLSNRWTDIRLNLHRHTTMDSIEKFEETYGIAPILESIEEIADFVIEHKMF